MTDIEYYRAIVMELLKQSTMIGADESHADYITHRALTIFKQSKKIEDTEINVFKVTGETIMNELEKQSKFKKGGITVHDVYPILKG